MRIERGRSAGPQTALARSDLARPIDGLTLDTIIIPFKLILEISHIFIFLQK